MTGLLMKYFVLKPAGNDPYAKASRAAMRQYAKLIREENSQLHDDLIAWTDREFFAAQETCPGHVASEHDPKVCGRCGIHIDELRS